MANFNVDNARDFEDKKKILRPDWVELAVMSKKGYQLISDDGTYLKYMNKDGLVSNGYGPMPAGKRLIYFNCGYSPDEGVFVGIREDGDTRTVYNGVIATEETFKLILNTVR